MLFKFCELLGAADEPEDVAGLEDEVGPGVDVLLSTVDGHYESVVVVAEGCRLGSFSA